MRIAVCEDEKIFRSQLVRYLERAIASLDLLIDEYSCGEDLLESYKAGKQYDVVFLDIEMKQIDGITTAKRIREYKKKEELVFLTSHTEYALEGYEVDALRFLEKPVKEEKLRETLQIIKGLHKNTKSLFIHCKDGEYLISPEQVLYVESIGNDLHIYTEDGKVYRERRTLKEFYNELEQERFFQCHRSYIVNLNQISSYSAKQVVLKDGKIVPVSRGKGNELRNRLMDCF